MENQSATALRRDGQLKKFFNLWAIVYVFIFIAFSQFIPSMPFYEKFIVWVGKTFLHIKDLHKIERTGSGDTTYDYVLVFVNIIISCFISLIILITDHKRKTYRQLYLFTIVIARYYVAYTMLSYGFAKIFNGQFPGNGYYRLEEKVGDMSPMGMVWTFMGASRTYTFVSGLLECIGGALLLFRKTKTFGSLFSMTVMLNVALLNFMYDVPVKIFSTHIVLLCIFMLTYEWKILFNFFVKHRTEKLDYNKLRVRKKWMQISLRAIKILLIAYLLYSNITGLWFTLKEDKIPMEGVYTVNTFILDKDTISANTNEQDSTGWNKIYVAYKEGISITHNNQKSQWLPAKIDTTKQLFDVKNQDSTQFALLNYSLNKDTVIFTGNIKNLPAKIITVRKTKKDYSLTNRGFHWINEYPPNW
ncbi:hypothetical protein A9P82_11975 [Arachidicoccus ginsenosidimutans]|uniref:hypothetical protein n=1 Tax=Arachidicoccus sp. BS20 TaxID=1850526 RepID=UPI0007F105C5|nr:hypothetical protein [Arachidicoccus sp. BS20]ANI89943.1 hypothetical protein A9P82_11975 [Arachidicoccus sp. BS20]